MLFLFASIASFFAGCIDSIVGGGGLILVPSLFALYPSAAPATLFGTNKSASIWGTAFAAQQLARKVSIDARVMLPAAVVALAAAFAGAWGVTRVNPSFLRQALPLVLLAVLIYVLVKKNLGQQHLPSRSPLTARLIACTIGLFMGAYDGFFGPGTGSFLIFLFVRLLGYDFLHASAAAKLINVATNLAALTLFATKGHVWWSLGLAMAVANVAGSLVGASLALRWGTKFVRWAFIAVVLALIFKTGCDAIGK